MKRLCLALSLLCAGPAANAEPPHNLDHGLALKGYDAVSYQTQTKPQKGRAEFALKINGETYLFGSAQNLAAFKQDPAKYEPAYGGWCAYAMAEGEKVDVDPETYKLVKGKLHLFYNGWLGNTLKKWNRDEPGLKARADAQWPRLH